MLLLKRKKNETIMIGDYIKVEFVKLDGEQAVIGISAPKNIPVDRQEIYDKKKSILRKILGFNNQEMPVEGEHYAI